MTDSTPDASTDSSAEAPDEVVDADDLLVLARVAGLPIEDDRAAGLARELASTLIAVRELDALLADQPALAACGFSPYDPAWSDDESTPGTGAGR